MALSMNKIVLSSGFIFLFAVLPVFASGDEAVKEGEIFAYRVTEKNNTISTLSIKESLGRDFEFFRLQKEIDGKFIKNDDEVILRILSEREGFNHYTTYARLENGNMTIIACEGTPKDGVRKIDKADGVKFLPNGAYKFLDKKTSDVKSSCITTGNGNVCIHNNAGISPCDSVNLVCQ